MKTFRNTGIVFTYLVIMLSSIISYSQKIDSIKQLISKSTNKIQLLDLYKKLSEAYTNINDSNGIQTSFTQLKIAQELKIDIEIANAYKLIALAYKMHGDDYTALKNFFNEKAIRDRINDNYGKVILLANIGETYRAVFEHQKALDYVNKSLSLSKQIDYTYGTAYALNRLASVYFEFNDTINFQKSISLANESNRLAYQIGNNSLISNNYLIIGGSLSYFHKYDESLEYLFKSLEYNLISQETIHKSLILKSISVAYYYKKDYLKTLEYARLALIEAKKYNVKVYKWLAADITYRAYKEIKQWDSAYAYLDYYLAVKDEMYNEEKEYALFRTELKYQKIDFDRIEKANSEKQLMIFAIFGISLASLISIITLIYLRNKKLSKINKQLSEKNSIIEKQKEELSVLNSTKDKFFSIIAHDLKNPLGSFKFTTATLRNSFFEFTEEERIEFLDLMKDSAENVYSLLENLLEWSRSQRGTLNFNPIEFDVYTLATNNITSTKFLADHKNITLDNRINPDTIICADINMMNTIIRNLLTNAVKFTKDNGHISIFDLVENGIYKLSVKDTGIGIEKSKIEKLFRIDAQVSTHGTNNERGTGLGLILCKEFIEKHNGAIRVESIPNSGSTFTIELPIKKLKEII